MATFKVGDRVRVARVVAPDDLGYAQGFVGSQGTIVGTASHLNDERSAWDWIVKIDGLSIRLGDLIGVGEIPFVSAELEPIDSPAADEDTWAVDKVKQVTKYEPYPVLPMGEVLSAKIARSYP